MNNWRINTTVDLDQLNTARVLENTNALFNYADIVAHTWNVTVLESGAAADLSGYTATLTVRRPDGNKPVTNCTIEDNVISVDFPQVCYAIEGECVAVIKLIKSGSDPEEITLAAMTYNVVNYDGTGTIIDPGTLVTDISVLQGYVATMNDATDAATTAAAAASAYPGLVAPNFSTSGTYNYGDLVIKDGNLYRCKKPVTTAGSWSSSNWTAVTVSSAEQYPFSPYADYVSANGLTRSAANSLSIGSIPPNRLVYIASNIHPEDTSKTAFTDEPTPRFSGFTMIINQTNALGSGCFQLAWLLTTSAIEIYIRRRGSSAWEAWHSWVSDTELAPIYSASSSYSKGDYVVYRGKLYVANQNISAEAWTSGHWTAKTIGGILKNFESRIAALES